MLPGTNPLFYNTRGLNYSFLAPNIMALSNRAILDVIELVYYIPAVVLSFLVAIKHGLGRQLGWIFLTILSLLRIISASTGIAYEGDPPNSTLGEVTVILNTVGLSPLLLVWLGLIKRVNQNGNRNKISPGILEAINFPVIIGLILAIYGGTKIFSSSTNAVNNGLKFSEAAAIVFLLTLILLGVITIYTSFHSQDIPRGERPLLFASVLGIPFLFVRVLYLLVVDFDWSYNTFGLISTSNRVVIVDAVMAVLMEFVVVSIYLMAGFGATAITKKTVQDRSMSSGV